MKTKQLINVDQVIAMERAPDLSFVHKFKGFGIHDSEVKVEIYLLAQTAVVLFTDTGKGTSITNAAEQVVTEVYNQHLRYKNYHPNNVLFAETYDKIKDGIDAMVLNWKLDTRLDKWYVVDGDIDWKHIGKIVKS